MKILLTRKQLNVANKFFIVESGEEKMEFEISYKKNPDVENLQKFLIDKGYYIGKFGANKDGIDGKYGPFTKAAHEAFKKNIPAKDFDENKRNNMAQKYIGDVNDETLEKEFNFHLIPDGKGTNYRSAQIPITVGSDERKKEFLGPVLDKYGIKRIIRMNHDNNDSFHYSIHGKTLVNDERELAKSKGIEFHYKHAIDDHEEIKNLLKKGNALIHCAHGADRTGGNVAGYLRDIGWGDAQKIWNYTTKLNGWNKKLLSNPENFRFMEYAKMAGAKDLKHAIQLAKDGKK